MNEDSRLAALLREVARDVPARSDDEAVDALRGAVARRDRSRGARFGAAVAAAAAVVAAIVWAASPSSDDETRVASADGEPAQPAFTVDVTADLDGYAGVLPPVVVVSAEGTTVTVVDPLSREGVTAYATVTTSQPVAAASIGPRGRSLLLTLRAGEMSSVVQVDLAGDDIERRWDGAAAMVTAPGHERVAYLQPAGADGGRGVVIEDLAAGTRQVFSTPAAGPGLDGWLSWSSDGRLAVGGADGTVWILDPATATSFDDASPVMGPLFGADWAGPDSLIGTGDCCEPSDVIIVEVSTGAVERIGTTAIDVAAIEPAASPWGSFYVDADGRLRATGTDPDIDLGRVAKLEW